MSTSPSHPLLTCAEVDAETGLALAESLGWEFFETSAKANLNVEAAFEAMLARVRESLKTTPHGPSNVTQIEPRYKECT